MELFSIRIQRTFQLVSTPINNWSRKQGWLHTAKSKEQDICTQLKRAMRIPTYIWNQKTGHFYTTKTAKKRKSGRFYTVEDFLSAPLFEEMNFSNSGTSCCLFGVHPSGNLPKTATKSFIYNCFFFSIFSTERIRHTVPYHSPVLSLSFL